MSSLAKIHVGKKQLGLADEDYRDLLEGATGKRSSADLNESQRLAVIDAMIKAGFKPAVATGSRIRSPHPHVRKVFGIWGEAFRAGAVEKGSRQALAAFVKRQTGISDPNWLTAQDANRVIEGIKAILARHRDVRRQAPDRGGSP